MENVTYNLKEYTNTDNYPENLKQKLTEYFNDEGRTELKQLWTVPNLPFLTNLPTDGHPEHESKRNNSFETMPKQIASDFNTKLDQISKKKLRTNFPLHPALKDYSVPGSGYAQPETVEINPEYPPFYNKYLDAKKKAGLA
jgi:hypothetical protein